MDRLFRFLSSLKLAVTVILSFAVALTVATFIESLYDTRTAQFWVYRAWWFKGLMIVLGINIFAVMVDRWPWKKRHTPFIMAHIGILTLLLGSWMTQQFGIDGTLVVKEGETGSLVDLDTQIFAVRSDEHLAIEVPWRPPGASFSPIDIRRAGVKITEFISHSEPEVKFGRSTDAAAAPAIHLRMEGGPMRMRQEFWLWAGNVGWSTFGVGPARFLITSTGGGRLADVEGILSGGGQALFAVIPGADGSFRYRAIARSGAKREGVVKEPNIVGKKIRTGWMRKIEKEFTVTVLDWIPKAENLTYYRPARVQYGNRAPGSAIKVETSDGKSRWLGLGERAQLRVSGKLSEVAFYNRRVYLPFGVFLTRFNIDHYQGTRSPAEYSSRVRVVDQRQSAEETVISMNEPLHWGGFTFYQSSYVPGNPRPTTSVFSVNRDIGRWPKYIGSILIVLGAILLFAVKCLPRVRGWFK